MLWKCSLSSHEKASMARADMLSLCKDICILSMYKEDAGNPYMECNPIEKYQMFLPILMVS